MALDKRTRLRLRQQFHGLTARRFRGVRATARTRGPRTVQTRFERPRGTGFDRATARAILYGAGRGSRIGARTAPRRDRPRPLRGNTPAGQAGHPGEDETATPARADEENP